MKFIIILFLVFSIVSCEKNTNNECKGNLIRDVSDTTLNSTFYTDTINFQAISDYKYVYDIVALNYCENKINHTIFQSNKKYNLKINQKIYLDCKMLKIFKFKLDSNGKEIKDKNGKKIIILDSIKTCNLLSM